MKVDFEDTELKGLADALALEVIEKLRPILQAKDIDKDGDKIFTVEGLAQYLGVKKSWIYEKVHLKGIPHYKVGRFPRFRKAHIDKWLQETYTPALNNSLGHNGRRAKTWQG